MKLSSLLIPATKYNLKYCSGFQEIYNQKFQVLKKTSKFSPLNVLIFSLKNFPIFPVFSYKKFPGFPVLSLGF
jgi:hypothetical protein